MSGVYFSNIVVNKNYYFIGKKQMLSLCCSHQARPQSNACTFSIYLRLNKLDQSTKFQHNLFGSDRDLSANSWMVTIKKRKKKKTTKLTAQSENVKRCSLNYKRNTFERGMWLCDSMSNANWLNVFRKRSCCCCCQAIR